MSNLSPNDPLAKEKPSVDLSSLTPQELKLYKLYGKLPKKSDILQSKLKDRKFFDSGDYAMSKLSGHKEQVGSANPLRSPALENVARINRNSISGINAPNLLNANQQKSTLEQESNEDAEKSTDAIESN
ncbi:unnamed protein product [Ambrosiozyma monospora]|uniref:mRNA stability protein n=1 Tax=Ambrosiozyma monospora TaxID=43982 RepID=A0A9W6Z2F3_AMBMO|nr:unnamed protein product [Ambrosiozyma monospora]